MDSSFDTNLFIVVIIQFIIGIFGIFLNSGVVYITIKHKQLRKLSGFILGAICFYDALYGINGIIPFVTMSAQFQIPLSICFFLQSPSPFIVLNSGVLMFFLGLERLLAVLLPIWHFSINSQSKQLKYAIFILFITFAGNFIIFFLIYDYFTGTGTPQKPVYCLVSDILQGFALTFGANLGLITNLMTIAVYLLLWISVKLRKLNDADANQRINKSIFVLITIYLLLWSISILFSSILIPNSTLDPQSKVFLSRLFVQLNRLATALNAPVLYFCSSEYRTFFRKEFKFLGHPNLGISSRNNEILRQQSTRFNNFMPTISSRNIGHSLPIIN